MNMRNADHEFADLSEFEPRQVEWLLQPLIPLGMLTIMEGDPGVSKSYLAMHFAAIVSVGGVLPNKQRVTRGRVLYLSAEDDASYTIRPRIDAMGGDPKRVRLQVRYAALDDDGLARLHREIKRATPDLVVIDPLYSYISGDADLYRPNVIRPFLSKLNDIAERTGAAVLLIRHLTKARKDRAIYQGAGSIDVSAVARSVLLVAKHPRDEARRVVAHVKNNVGPLGPCYAYQLSGGGSCMPIIKWLGEVALSATDLHASTDGDQKSAYDEAVEFLRETLTAGPKPQKTIQQNAERRNISSRTLDRAKRRLKIRSTKTKGGWLWALPKK